ncbi:MAG: preprotein translocase subunit YajC [Bacteroidaceae bacterium]|nr:preprotein translocase subunit YajC [Bacteroidaceae bacterium]MBP9637021.1 preprotein translocase subunit YajC [Bacteroidaceae bacterium]
MTLLSILLQAQEGGGMSMILMMVAMFAILYFFMIRPQQKKQKEIEKFRRALEVGQNVVTAGGVHGVIKEIQDTVVIIEIAAGVRITVEKASVYASGTAIDKK